ncbi:MAG: threonine/serine exporter family protein [Bacillota bacterium]
MNLHKKDILNLALYAGEIMLKNGAETYRVEDTIIRICHAYGVSFVESFVTPTGIFVSMNGQEDEQDALSFIKRIKSRTIDLNKVSQVNDFSRKLTESHISVVQGMKILKEIDDLPKYHRILKILSAGSASAFFGVLLGATKEDYFSAFLIATIVYLAVTLMDRLNASLFMQNAIGGFTAASLSILAIQAGMGDNTDKIIISSIMILLPGVAITNAVRDSISGDLLSGLARAAEAVIIAISIAVGVGIVINIWINLLGGTLS